MELNKNDISEELKLSLKDIERMYGKEDKLDVFDDKHNLCYCYNDVERCYSIDNKQMVKGIIVTNKYKTITINKNKINDTFDSIIKNSGKKEFNIIEDNECIKKSLKYEYDNYDILYSSNLYCNKDDINNIDYILITKN